MFPLVSPGEEESTGLPSLHHPQVGTAVPELCRTWNFRCFILPHPSMDSGSAEGNGRAGVGQAVTPPG